MLNRRQLLTTGAVAAAGTLLAPSRAEAAPPDPETAFWLDWIAGHRDAVAVAGTGPGVPAIRHRADQPQLLASTIKIIHATAYATAVAQGRLDPREPIRLGDWDARHPYVSDGGAHRAALTALGVACNEYGVADDPEQTVPLDTLTASMIDFSDNAATDYLRHRLGDPALHRAALAGGWRRPDLRSLQGEVLMLIMPELAPPADAPVALRRAVGDRLARRFIDDLGFREQTLTRIPQMPETTEEQWPWVQRHARGTATEVAGMHRAVAAGTVRPRAALPIVRGHLERGLAPQTPPDAYGIGFKGGSLPKVFNAGLNVRWRNGEVGVLVIMITGLSDEESARGVGLIKLGVEALTRPDRYAALAAALA